VGTVAVIGAAADYSSGGAGDVYSGTGWNGCVRVAV